MIHMPAGLSSGGVLFAEDFDIPVKHGEVEEQKPVEPIFTGADVAAIRSQAWQDGYEAATAAARTAERQAMGQIAGAIVAALGEAKEHAAALALKAADELARLLLDSMAALLPSLFEQHSETELRRVVALLVPALRQEPSIVVHLNPANTAPIAREIELLDPEFASRVQVVSSPSIAPGGIRVSWRRGQATRDVAALWSQVAEILAPAGLLSFAAEKEAEHVG